MNLRVNELSDQRIGLAVDRLQNGLRIGETHDSQQRAADLADQLARIELDSSLLSQFESAPEFKAEHVKPTVDNLRRLRKVTEIVEDDLGVDIGHSRFAKAATSLSKLSSLGSIAIAGHNLLLASVDLIERYQAVGTLEKVEEGHYTTFYQALGIFVIDCMLFATPLNFKAAWSGTRFINNRFLYRLRRASPSLHRYALSEMHYVIRGIPPKILHGAVHYYEYLRFVTMSTFEVLWEFERDEIGAREVSSKVSKLIEEFHDFISTNYDIDTPELDWKSLYREILEEVKDFVDVSLWSIDEMMSQIEPL